MEPTNSLNEISDCEHYSRVSENYDRIRLKNKANKSIYFFMFSFFTEIFKN